VEVSTRFRIDELSLSFSESTHLGRSFGRTNRREPPERFGR